MVRTVLSLNDETKYPMKDVNYQNGQIESWGGGGYL